MDSVCNKLIEMHTTTPTENALTTPINFDTSSSIQGEESQILQIKLQPNQTLRAESGAMLFMTEGVEMGTYTGHWGG